MLRISDAAEENQTDFVVTVAGLSFINPCPAEPNLSFSVNTVDPDQMASDEAIRSVSALFYTLNDTTSLQLETCRLTG